MSSPRLPNLLIQFCLLSDPHPTILSSSPFSFSASSLSWGPYRFPYFPRSILDPSVPWLHVLQARDSCSYAHSQSSRKPSLSQAPRPACWAGEPGAVCVTGTFSQEELLTSGSCPPLHLVVPCSRLTPPAPALSKFPSQRCGIRALPGPKSFRAVAVSQNKHKRKERF